MRAFAFLKRFPFFKGGEWVIPALAVLGLGFALRAVLVHKTPPREGPPLPPPQSAFEQNVSGIGVVEPRSEFINVATELSGVVRRVPVDVGERVKKGDTLFVLDTREVMAQMNVLEKSLASARVQAQDAGAQFESVRRLKGTPAVSQDLFNQRHYAHKLALSKVKELEAQLNQAHVTRERLNVRAPLTGVVLQVNVWEGEYAAAGVSQTPAMVMGDTTRAHVRVEFDEENIRHIQPHTKAYGVTRDNPTQKIPLTFVYEEPYVLPKQNLAVAGQRVDTRVLQVVYALPATTEGIFMGQQMDVFVETEKGS